MTKYITVKLTEEQLRHITYTVGMDINGDYPNSEKFNAFNIRIINKLNKALAEDKS